MECMMRMKFFSPERFNRNSTNPWDHDDNGNGEALANPNDLTTGPDVNDTDDDNDSRDDLDYDILEEGFTADPCYQGAPSSDWDHDNDCVLDEDDKALTFITLDIPGNLWLDARSPAIFSGVVEWINPICIRNASGLPVQIHIEWADNGTTAVETTNILSDQNGNTQSANSFIQKTSLLAIVRPTRFAVVTEMFAFNGATSADYLVGVKQT